MIPIESAQIRMSKFEEDIASFGEIIRISLDNVNYALSGHPSTADSYALSPTYLLTLGRRGLWSYKDAEGNGSCFFCWHPNNDGQIIILPAYGIAPEKTIQNLVQLLPPPEKGFILARVTDEQQKTFSAAVENGFFIPQPEKLLDWEYPCHILDTKAFATLDGANYQSMRRNVKPFINGTSGEAAELKPFLDKRVIYNLLQIWGRPGEQGNGDAYDLQSYFHHMYGLAEEGLHHTSDFNRDFQNGDRKPLKLAALTMNGKKIGCIFWDEDRRNGTANYFGAIHDFSQHNIVATMLHLLSKDLVSRGIHTINLGGSETPRLDEFKRRLHPSGSYNLVTYAVVPDKGHKPSPKPPITSQKAGNLAEGGVNPPSLS